MMCICPRRTALPMATILLSALLASPSLAAKTPTADEAAEAYVQGRMALANDNLVAASERFAVALKADDDDGARRRAFDVAMLSGDMQSAVKLANRIVLPEKSRPGEELSDSIIALTRAAGAAVARDWRSYDAVRIGLTVPARGESARLFGTLLEAYGHVGRGNFDAALQVIDGARNDSTRGIPASYLTEHRAHILAIARRWPEAADAYGALLAAEGANVSRLRIATAAASLEASATDPAYRSKAITALGGGLEHDPQLVEARTRLAADPAISGRKLGGLPRSATDGLGQLFIRLSADLGRERIMTASLGFARLATLVAPTMPDSWLLVSETLVRGEKPDLALAALDNLPPGSANREMADARRATILVNAGRTDEARAMLLRLATRRDAGVDDWSRLAELERRAGRLDQAADYYGRALQLVPPPEGLMHAQLLFLRGSAYEQAGNWKSAEPDLRKSAGLQPDNPVILNYLGYSLLDRRQDIDEASELIARAFKVTPDNGAIIDSMGWAEYVRGNYQAAVQLLEKARAAEPADPTVADHLGDALWMSGRKFEARHAWNSAAALSPEPKLAAILARKLDFGLDIALASK